MQNLMNVSVAFFDINSDSFYLFTVEGQPPRDCSLNQKAGGKYMYPHDEDQRLRAGGLKRV